MVALFEPLQDDDEPWTTGDAHGLAYTSDDEDLHIGKRAIRKYLKALADEGVFKKIEGDNPTDLNEYRHR